MLNVHTSLLPRALYSAACNLSGFQALLLPASPLASVCCNPSKPTATDHKLPSNPVIDSISAAFVNTQILNGRSYSDTQPSAASTDTWESFTWQPSPFPQSLALLKTLLAGLHTHELKMLGIISFYSNWNSLKLSPCLECRSTQSSKWNLYDRLIFISIYIQQQRIITAPS